jgi:hypothetical protein
VQKKEKKDEGQKNLYRVRNPFEILPGFNFDLRAQPIYIGPLAGPSNLGRAEKGFLLQCKEHFKISIILQKRNVGRFFPKRRYLTKV